MLRKQGEFYDKWHRRVEGQIRDCMHQHPEWFKYRSEREKKFLINSLAKRIVGEIAAEFDLMAKDRKKGGLTSSLFSFNKLGVVARCAGLGPVMFLRCHRSFTSLSSGVKAMFYKIKIPKLNDPSKDYFKQPEKKREEEIPKPVLAMYREPLENKPFQDLGEALKNDGSGDV